MDKEQAKPLYTAARARFLAFEREHGGWVRTKNVRMHYLQWKNPGGVPLIWAHGSFSSAYEIATFADKLVQAGYRPIAIDYYGHGRTPIPKHEVSIYHVADDIAALMDALDIETAVVGGWSRGGAVAASFYHSYPRRTRGLMLVDGGSFSFGKINDTTAAPEEKTKAEAGTAIFTRSWPTEFDAFYELMSGDPALDATNPTYGFDTLGNLSQGDDKRWMICRGLFPWLIGDMPTFLTNNIHRPSLTPFFHWSMVAMIPKVIFRNLDVPMLIVDPVSPHDEYPATDQNRELLRMFPKLVTHQIYEDTSHAAPWERPTWFVRDATAFLEKIKRHRRRGS